MQALCILLKVKNDIDRLKYLVVNVIFYLRVSITEEKNYGLCVKEK